MSDHLSRKVADIVSQFENVPKRGVHDRFTGLPYFSNIIADHISGYTQYVDDDGNLLYILNHQIKNDSSCRILFSKNLNGPFEKINTPASFNHTGGIQAVGKYLFVPCSRGDNSIVAVYDLKTRKEKPVIDFIHMAGSSAVGITDFIHNGTTYYLLLVSQGTTYNAYIAKVPKDGDMAKAVFKERGNFVLRNLPSNVHGRDIKCDGFGLVTERKEGIPDKVYMIGLQPDTHGLTYRDMMYLIELTINDTEVGFVRDTIKDKHLTSVGGVAGDAGTHFRWGAGININASNNLVVLATSRNIIAGTFLNATSWTSEAKHK